MALFLYFSLLTLLFPIFKNSFVGIIKKYVFIKLTLFLILLVFIISLVILIISIFVAMFSFLFSLFFEFVFLESEILCID